MRPEGAVERPDLRCPRCGGEVLQKLGAGTFVFSCVNYWSPPRPAAKCWTCASLEADMERVTDVPGQLDLFGAAS